MRVINKLLFLFVLLSFWSCEKVIELELNDSDIKYVIKGIVTNEPGVCKVQLTKSKPFYTNNEFPGVSGAIVTVKDNGREVLLNETQPGVYEAGSIKGTPGHVYELTVTVDNQKFTASCTMPQPVTLDTLYVSPGPLGQFKFATVGYTDPISDNNNYRFVQYVNGVKDPEIFWANDEFTNGQSILMQLDTGVDKKDDPRNINTGDAVTIEMLCLDEVIYRYWYSLRSGGGEGSSDVAAPANPITNIQGGALGYFSAQTVDRRTVIAP
jgi:hypothetical protein